MVALLAGELDGIELSEPTFRHCDAGNTCILTQFGVPRLLPACRQSKLYLYSIVKVLTS